MHGDIKEEGIWTMGIADNRVYASYVPLNNDAVHLRSVDLFQV